MARLLLFLFFIGMLTNHHAQTISDLKMTDFELHNSATKISENCFRLTSETNWDAGSIWNNTAIDLTANFEMEIDLMLGCKDYNGADGIVFVFYPHKLKTGIAGGDIGFGGLSPSLGIEIDTWANEDYGDPGFDHIAIVENGTSNHNHNFKKPVQANRSQANIEDCKTHRMRVFWNATAKELAIYFDGVIRSKMKKDLVKETFKGNPNVFWGFTSATGGQNNRQEVCIEKIVYEEAEPVERFEETEEKKLLEGERTPLEGITFPSGSAELSPESLTELKKILQLMRENPAHSIVIAGHTDSSGSESTNKKISQIRADAIKGFLIEKGISGKRIQATGYGEAFPIAPNNTAAGRLKNRRMEIYLTKLRA